MASEATTLQVGDHEMRVSSPSRVVWPEAGITKLDLAKYLVDVSEAFLRANGDRPVALERFGDTVEGESFYSKNPPKGCRTGCALCRWPFRVRAPIAAGRFDDAAASCGRRR